MPQPPSDLIMAPIIQALMHFPLLQFPFTCSAVFHTPRSRGHLKTQPHGDEHKQVCHYSRCNNQKSFIEAATCLGFSLISASSSKSENHLQSNSSACFQCWSLQQTHETSSGKVKLRSSVFTPRNVSTFLLVLCN